MLKKLKNYKFMFEELVSRDFKQKYKRTTLGMLWSILSPLLTLFIMRIVFVNFFGRGIEHYTTYLFCGNLIFSYYRESSTGGMNSLVSNASIITKINAPKYLFLLSKNVASLINFGLTLIIFFIFCIFDGVTFGWNFFMLIFPIVCLVVFNVGIGMVLSALYVFFKDIAYLFDIFNMLLMYCSAIFYQIDTYSETVQRIFLINPVYCYIHYFRVIVLDGRIPSIQYHALCVFYAAVMLLIGMFIYKKYNQRFLYYL
ncbi:MAG: ABC transporter permease [Lachnospiraceae bacterium]|nr:ABC transporter permease [Lachnospiraceae bacterium]